jgi:hypothetical protein
MKRRGQLALNLSPKPSKADRAAAASFGRAYWRLLMRPSLPRLRPASPPANHTGGKP